MAPIKSAGHLVGMRRHSDEGRRQGIVVLGGGRLAKGKRQIIVETDLEGARDMHTLPWLWSTWPISWGVAVLLYATFMPRFIKKAFHDIDEEEKEKASSLPSPQ